MDYDLRAMNWHNVSKAERVKRCRQLADQADQLAQCDIARVETTCGRDRSERLSPEGGARWRTRYSEPVAIGNARRKFE